MTTQPEDARVRPMRVGPYALLAKLGEGGMGIVHLARGADGQRVALKVLRPHIAGDDEARGRLAREVNSLTRVRSPWIAEMVAADPWAETPYVVTRYVPGPSLYDYVLDEGPITGPDLLWLAGCLAEGIAAVHGAGVLHRDVKPGNVLMEGRTPILIDFGLARVADDVRLTQIGFLMGTPGYLAPEILYGDEATPAADVHAWAATVAYAATGRQPYGRGPSTAIMDRTRRGEHDLSGVSGELRAVLDAALAPDPLARPLLEEILAWLRPLSTRPELPTVPPPVALFDDSPAGPDDAMTMPLVLGDEPPAPPLLAPVTPMPGAAVTMPPPPPPPAARTRPESVVQPAAVTHHPSDQVPTMPALERMEQEWDALHGVPPEPRAPLDERLRRGIAVMVGAFALGTAVATVPWIATFAIVLAAWVLRAGSMAASAVAERRNLRGVKWYDGVGMVFSSPWHLVRAVLGTLILVLWSAALGVAAGLLCYAFVVDIPVALLTCGTAFAFALWTGPGAERLRGPVSLVLHPIARQPLPWLILVAVMLGAIVGLGVTLASQGVTWLPWGSGPFGM